MRVDQKQNVPLQPRRTEISRCHNLFSLGLWLTYRVRFIE
jgi:hypothetical protein